MTKLQASRHVRRAGGSDPIMAAAELLGCGCGLIVLIVGLAMVWGLR